MTFSEWKSNFIGWHTQRNAQLVAAKSSMEMIVELQQCFEKADKQTKSWMIDLFREWQKSGNEFQKYDGRVMLSLNKISE